MLTPNYVHLTFADANGRKRTYWAIKLKKGVYRRVRINGDRTNEIVIGAPSDIKREVSASMNNIYGELEEC